MRTTTPRSEYVEELAASLESRLKQFYAGSRYGFRVVAPSLNPADAESATTAPMQLYAYPVRVEVRGQKGTPQFYDVMDSGWIPVQDGFTGIRVSPYAGLTSRQAFYSFQLADSELDIIKNPPPTQLLNLVASSNGAPSGAKYIATDSSGRIITSGGISGSGGTFGARAVTSAAALAIPAAPLAGRTSIFVQNRGPNSIWLGLANNVTATNGLELIGNGGEKSFTINDAQVLWAIADTAIQVTPLDTRYWELP